MTSNQRKAAALFSTISLGCLDRLLQDEPPKSARRNRISNAIDSVNRVVDIYRLEAFPYEDMRNAGEILDLINDKIKELYP